MSHKIGYTSRNHPLQVRLHPIGKKDQFITVARECGDVPTDLINQFVDWYLGLEGAQLPLRPDVVYEKQPATA